MAGGGRSEIRRALRLSRGAVARSTHPVRERGPNPSGLPSRSQGRRYGPSSSPRKPVAPPIQPPRPRLSQRCDVRRLGGAEANRHARHLPCRLELRHVVVNRSNGVDAVEGRLEVEEGQSVHVLPLSDYTVPGAISSTSRTILRRSFGSSIHMNAFTKERPSDVARKSVT